MIKEINNICGSLLTTTSFIISTWYWILKQDTREMEVSIQPLNDFFLSTSAAKCLQII